MKIDINALFKLSYGLFVLSTKSGGMDDGCIINTGMQITEKPLRITIAVNKSNLTHDMIVKTKDFNLSVLCESAPFSVFEKFGYHSGRDTNKFSENDLRTENGICYLTEHTNAVISASVVQIIPFETHSLFIADVAGAFNLSNEPSATYQYYFSNIKPKPRDKADNKKGFVCKICGYAYDGGVLPDDYICPTCGHGADYFERA